MQRSTFLPIAVVCLMVPFIHVLINETKYLGSTQHLHVSDLDLPPTPTVNTTELLEERDALLAKIESLEVKRTTAWRPIKNASPWPLWHEMNETQQQIKLEEAFARAAPYGTMLGRQEKYHNTCKDGNKPILMGSGGEHMVCGPPPLLNTTNNTSSCKFFSFGIRDDPSWDIHLGDSWNCRGFAGDPSIVHPSKIHPTVTFHNVGLKMLRSNVEQRKDPKDEWILVSMPQLRKFLNWTYIDIIKIDCEGCEVAMARDILAEDPTFLDNVGQLSIETHVTRTWVNSTEELYYYALMFVLLEDAGFKLIWSNVFGCGKWEHDGCREELNGKMNMSCGNRPRNKVNRVPIGWSCHDWLWARV